MRTNDHIGIDRKSWLILNPKCILALCWKFLLSLKWDGRVKIPFWWWLQINNDDTRNDFQRLFILWIELLSCDSELLINIWFFVCSRSPGPFYIVTYYIKRGKTSRTYGTLTSVLYSSISGRRLQLELVMQSGTKSRFFPRNVSSTVLLHSI